MKAELAKAIRNDPRVFARKVLSLEPDDWQEEVLAAAMSNPRIALKACKGPGKSFVLAILTWWWLFTRWHSNVICVSITADNLRDNLWTELARLYDRSTVLQELFTLNSERIESRKHPKTWWASARAFPQNADRTQQANTIAGFHGRHPMVVCDEVGDFPDGVVVAAEAIFANDVDARLVMAGNPTRTEGPLYRVCMKDRSRWWVKEITGDPKDPKRAKRISMTWAQQMIDDWGAENPWVLVNVFGQFPPQQSNMLIGPGDVDAALGRVAGLGEFHQEPVVMALDVARYGDNESVLARRQGKVVYQLRAWRELDLMTLSDQVAREVFQHKPRRMYVDGTGVGGGVVDRLRQLGVDVVSIDFGGKASDERFYDKRSEMWWGMAGWIKSGGCLPQDTALRNELLAPTFSYTNTSRVTRFKLESKQDLRRRGVSSPDRADAIAMTFALPVAYDAPNMVMLPSGYPKPRGRSSIDKWDPWRSL